MVMVHAIADSEESYSGGLGSFAIDRAVTDINRLPGPHSRALHAQVQNVRRWLRANIVECTRDRIEDRGEFQMFDQRRNRCRSIGRKRQPISSLEFEHKGPQLQWWA